VKIYDSTFGNGNDIFSCISNIGGTVIGKRLKLIHATAAPIREPIYTSGTSSTTITGSIIIGGGNGIMNSAGSTAIYYNNVFYNFKTNGFYNASSVIPIIKNNIFYGQTGAACINDGGSVTETNTQIDYNIYRNSVLTNQANSGGSHSLLSTDPLFINTGTDFHLASGSPAINAGVSVGLTSDYDGKPVPMGAGVDIGAYEKSGVSSPFWIVHKRR
jgi:hypothetical protein